MRGSRNREKRERMFGSTLDKKRILALLVAATVLAATITPLLNTPMTRTHQTQVVTPTRNPTTFAPNLQWTKTYGGAGDDEAESVQQTTDGGYIVAGYTDSFAAGWHDFWLVKTDDSGNQQWNKTYGGTDDDRAYSVQQTSDGGYIVAGVTDSFVTSRAHMWVVKTDGSGNQQWNRTSRGSYSDSARSVQQTSDGGYIIGGTTWSYGAASGDFWLVKTNSTGYPEWNKTFGGIDDEHLFSIKLTSDGGYIAAGYTQSFGSGGYDFWLVKTNSTGNQQWNKTYGGSSDDVAYSVQQTSDSEYVVAGYTDSFSVRYRNFWLVKTDASGDHQWNKTYGDMWYEEAYSVQQTSDGGYILAGYSFPIGHGQEDFWLVKTNSTGNMQWNRYYGGSSSEEAYSVQQTSDGGYISAGYTYSFGAGEWDFYLVKTGEGTPPSAISDLAAGSPTSDSITLTWRAPGDDGMKGNATGYTVKYSTVGCITASNWSSAATYAQSWTPAKNGTTETHVVKGLTSSTKYWFAMEAYDEGPNYSDVSNSANATTLPDTTSPATITDLAADTLSNTSVLLTWTAPGDDSMTGNATGYTVKYSTIGCVTASNWSSATTCAQSWKPTGNGTTEAHVVKGLSPATRYWFAIEAYDEVLNHGDISNSPNATTTATTNGGGGGGSGGGTEHGIPWSIILGGVAVVAGVVILIAAVLVRKRRSPSAGIEQVTSS
jgi:uncharacterized delta-60 repeat protein